MRYKIITDRDFLHKKTTPVLTIEEGQKIADKLISVLDDVRNGAGLSANQIGILKSVSVIKARQDRPAIVLMNPTIVKKSDERIAYMEGCLSIPGKQIPTARSMTVEVVTLNHANTLSFSPDVVPPTKDSVRMDYGLLECVCVQHEIDHLHGKLITDSDVRLKIETAPTIKYGRNDKVVVEKNGETQYIKYKKALNLIGEGWKII